MKTRIAVLLCFLMGAYQQDLQASPETGSDSLNIWVNGACGMCKTRIEKSALSIRGVESASWDAKSLQLTLKVDSNKFKSKKLHYKIASVGHDTKELKATEEAYNKVMPCCRYRDENVVKDHQN